MNSRSTRGILGALAFALGSLVAAAPVAAETVLDPCTGTCGDWEVDDQGPSGPAGANCRYETASQELDTISVRPPLMFGTYTAQTPVEWRYKIRHSNSFSGHRSTIFTSPWQSAMSDNSFPARVGHGFSRRYWSASENPVGYYAVRVEMRWLHHGSVEGTALVQYDWYKLQNTGFGDSVSPDPYCYQVA